MPTGLQTARQASGGFNPLSLASLRFFVHTDDGAPTNVFSGSGDSIGGSAPNNVQLIDAGQTWGSFDAATNQYLRISGAANPGNNVLARIANLIAPTAYIVNPSAVVPENPFNGTYQTFGKVYGVVDRKAAIAFSQAAVRSGPPVHPDQKPGHRVWGVGQGASNIPANVEAVDAVAALFNNAPALTLSVYANVVSFPGSGSGDGDVITIADAATVNGGSSHHVRYAITSTGLALFLRDGSTVGTASYTGGVQTGNGWKLYSVTYTGLGGAGSVKFYRDDTLLGSVTITHKNPLNLTRVILGRSFSTNPGGEYYQGAFFGFTGQLAPADMLALSQWCAKSFL